MRHTGRIPMNPAIFREYDIRGVAEVDFDTSFARSLGQAYASYLAAQAPPSRLRERPLISVGRDCRLSSDGYATALRQGLRECGIDVVDLGVCPTPLCYFSIFDLDLDGGIQVTGSHNPADQNGFKICVGKSSLHGDQIQALRGHLEVGRFPTGRGHQKRFDVITRYQEYLGSHVQALNRPLHLVIDAGNATAGPVAPAIFRAMGARVDELYCDLDGRFPHHHPDPTVEENLRDLARTVRAVGAEIGIAFDGDADRIGVVDHEGRTIWGDELLILFARDVLRDTPGPRSCPK